jgi:5-(carboxyamino)imidazole ribonucleotide mutase
MKSKSTPEFLAKALENKSMNSTNNKKLMVGVVMGSRSDWETMRHAVEILEEFEVPHECRVVSAHRTPKWMFEYASDAESRGLKIIIAGAGGSAHLPGMIASLTTLPVLGVPVKSQALSGLDSLLSIVQMPGGVPVGTLAIGNAGAKNAALLAIRMLANEVTSLRQKLQQFAENQEIQVIEDSIL